MSFWLQVGAAGFRIDAAPFIIEMVKPGVDPGPQDFSIMDSWRQQTQWLRGDSVLLCEANVTPTEIVKFVGSRPDGPSDRAHMMFDFLLNPRIWLALARCDAEPLIEALTIAVKLPEGGQWVSFLRNHDELDLSRLTDEQRGDVFRAFAPRPEMRLYGRGIRRRLAPMLGGDQRHIELAYALQFSLPGTPALRYGEEIGMGDDLSLDGRESVRTPMHWDGTPNAGFSTAARRCPVPTGRHDRQVRGKEGQRTGAARRHQFVAALVRAPDTHAAQRAGDRDRHMFGCRRSAAALSPGTPI